MTDIETARELLRAIPCSSLDYQEWTNVGMALHQEGLPCSLWAEWSATDYGRYHDGECEKKWRTFGNGDTLVTMGTVYHMAEEYGYSPADHVKVYSWDDMITSDGDGIDRSGWHHDDTVMVLPEAGDEWNQCREVTDYLSALFDSDEKVCYVNKAYKDKDGKWKPIGGTSSRTCADLIEAVNKQAAKGNEADLSMVFGTITPEAGMWVCFNPVDGEGRGNKNITEYRYALVESDNQDIETQYALIQDLKLPVKMLVHSGGKSLHAIVNIGATDYKQYRERVDYLYTVCRAHGLNTDTQDKNPSRLSRMPGFMRGDKKQYIVAKDIGLRDYTEWLHYIESDAVEPLEVVNMADVANDPPELKPELISGVLRQGHKMMLVSSSKAGKTFALIELAIAIAEGMRWLGFMCKQGRVLYLNMELDPASFDDRILKVYKAMEVDSPHYENIDIVHLRGKIEMLDKLIPRINRELKAKQYAAVILDPIYKLGIGDENAADEVGKFCNCIDRIANNGASVIYAHHHSKGAQGQKASMDRASGSGVFARDADSLLDMIEITVPEEHQDEISQIFGEKTTAWRLEATLREFPRIDPVNIYFGYPLHYPDDYGWLNESRLAEDDRALSHGRELGNVKKELNKKTNIQKLADAIERDEEFSGRRKTYEQYADEFGVSLPTIKRWMKELYAD